jgi:hypothetical protein
VGVCSEGKKERKKGTYERERDILGKCNSMLQFKYSHFPSKGIMKTDFLNSYKRK